MSDVVERTLSALPGLLGQHEPGAGLDGGGAGRSSATSRLGGLIRSITALASKHRLMKECMVRLIYCEMLGYEASFGYIHAIKLAQQGNLFEKRVGYLAVSLFLHENHELLLLLVNTVVKDLQSSNLMEVCMALTVASQIFPREMIPAVLPLIEDKLQHSKEIIRRKAVQALYKFYLIAPNQVQHIHDKFRKALCDRDVGVMAASLHIYLQMVKEDSSGYKDLTGSFVAILKQVVGGKLPVDFNYHSVPAPWLQIQLLRILGLLGKDDPRTSELMYDVLDESLRRAEINHNITYAILFECVQTIYTIHPKSDLLEKAAKCIGKFVLSPKINLKYLGFEDAKEDGQLRLQAVQSYLTLLEDKNAVYPQKFLQVMSWVLGEYSYLMKNVDPEIVLASLHRILRSNATSETKAWIMAAATKIATRTTCSKTVDKLIQEFSTSLDTCLRQYAFELKLLEEDKELMKKVFPVDASCEDIVVDASLSFLDGFVAEGLGRGAAPYKPHHQRQEEKLSQEKALNFEPYGLALSQRFLSSGFTGRQSPTGLSLGSDISGNSAEAGQKEINSLKLDGVKKLWGKEGYLPKKESQVEKDNIKPVLQGSASVEHVADNLMPQSEQEVIGLLEGEKEKQQLASTLFVGLGSQGSLSLMGKGDSANQKFKRKSKISEVQNSKESSSSQSTTNSSLGPFPDALSRNKELFQNNGHLRFRKASLSSPETLESKVVFDRSHSLPEAGLNEKLLGLRFSPSVLCADGNMDVFQPSTSSQPVISKQFPLTPALPEELAKHPHSEILELCGDEALVLYSCKVWKDDCVLLCFFLANKTTSVLKVVNLEFEHTEHFMILESFGCNFSGIEAHSIENFQKCIEIGELCSEGLLSGCISYHLDLDTHLRFSVTLALLDFIRPLKITTDEFGKLWLSFSNDVKQNLKMTSSWGSLSAVLSTLQQNLKLHIVDIIGNEGIAACRLLPSVPCLLHCRLHAGMLALWFRSPCSALPDCLLYQCQKVMEES
ncbi:hypothetical protein lerEdw1_008317 [Lerista edwardsae]|nr:hypothetical protein lerEdw1_008317 [Lerista edwardsae]